MSDLVDKLTRAMIVISVTGFFGIFVFLALDLPLQIPIFANLAGGIGAFAVPLIAAVADRLSHPSGRQGARSWAEASRLALRPSLVGASVLLVAAQIPFLLDVLVERYWNAVGMLTLGITFAVFWLAIFTYGIFHHRR